MNNPIDRRFVPGGMLPVDNLYGTAFTGEEDAHTFRITYYEGSEAVAFTGEIAGEFINPAGVTVPLSGSLDEDGRAIVTLDEHCYAVAGRFILTIWAGRKVIYCGVGQVMNSQTGTIDYPTSGIPDVAALIEQLQTILNNWPADYSQLQSDVSNLKSAFPVKAGNTEFYAGNKNYYDKTQIVLDTWINNGNGQEYAYSGWSSTGYIPIGEHTSFSFIVGGSNGVYSEKSGIYGAFYDASKTYVNGISGTLAGATIPENAKYFRISQETKYFKKYGNNVNPFSMIIDPTEWETVPTYIASYVPYGYTLTEGIDDITGTINYNALRSVPSWTIEEISGVVPKVRNLQGGNTVSFAFLTDLHNGQNLNIRAANHHAIQSLQSIEKQIPLDYVVFGGDYILNNTSTTIAECNEQIQDLMKYINEVQTPKFMLRGNHDSNFLNTSAPYTATMFYKNTDKFFEKHNGIKMYYSDLAKSIGYVDLENLKVRLIFANMTDVGDNPSGFGITWAQMDWFGKVALDFSDKTDKQDWGVIVFSHSYFEASSITDGGLSLAPQMHQMLLAFKAGTTYTYSAEHSFDYTSQGAMEVICAVVGHWHADRSAVVDGIQVIATMQTAGGDDEPADGGTTYAKVWGTTDETAYDIFTINRDTKTINTTRFGVGADRSWTY